MLKRGVGARKGWGKEVEKARGGEEGSKIRRTLHRRGNSHNHEVIENVHGRESNRRNTAGATLPVARHDAISLSQASSPSEFFVVILDL